MSKNREDVTQVPDAADKPPKVTAKTDLPSPSSKNSLSQGEEKVNNDYISKEASSQEENASFFDDYNLEKRVPKINPDEVIEGIWEDSPKRDKNIVEKGQLDSFDNNNEAWYNKNDIITDGSHLVNGKLKPNVKYKSGEYNYIYETDEFGSIARVHVEELKHTERKYRKQHKRNTSGKQKGDHAGHLIADRFGGSAELDNLVSQSAFVNLSEYKKLENIWDNAIKNGQKVSFDMQIKYDENSSRPSEFIVEYSVDGRNCKKTIKN